MALTAPAAGIATCALLAMLSSEGEVCPSGYWIDGLMGDGARPGPSNPSPVAVAATGLVWATLRI